MKERTAEILEAAVQEFINLGEPVSSGLLHRRHSFGIGPAMIRFELEDLVHQGFLEQPHHSAGRIPSDKGYEFFAERILRREPDENYREGKLKNLFVTGAWDELLHELSGFGLVSAVFDTGADHVYKDGVEALVDGLVGWAPPAEVSIAVHDFVALDERLKEAVPRMQNGTVRVFVGRKSPVTKCGSLSVITGRYAPDRKNIFLLAIGPKRMDYRRALSVFASMYE